MAFIGSERLQGWRFVLLNALLSLGHMIVLFNAGSYIAMMPHVVGELGGVAPSFGTWAQTDYMIALALAFPLSRWLSANYGAHRVCIAAFILYAMASYLCAVSESLWLFIPARILLGFSGGMTLPVGQSLLLKEYPDEKKLLGLAVWGLVTLMPFTISFPIGGALADGLGWRYLFYLNAPLALLIAAALGALLAGREFERSDVRFDFGGFFLLFLILGGLQTLLNQGNDFDWLESPFLSGVAILVTVAIPCFIIWEWGEHQPAFDIRLFCQRNYAIGVTCLVAGFLMVQGLLSMLIVQLQILLGYSSFLAGMVFLPMLVLAAPATLIMHKLVLAFDVRVLASLNLLGFAWILFWIGLFDEAASFDQIFWPILLLGLFLGSFFTPLTKLALHGLSGPKELAAAEVAGLLRIAAGSMGITLQNVVLFRRAPWHQLDLADHFGGRQFAAIDKFNEFSSKLNAAGLTEDILSAKLPAVMKQQASLLAVNDAFLLSGYLFIGLAALVWLSEPIRPQYFYSGKSLNLNDIQAEELMEEA